MAGFLPLGVQASMMLGPLTDTVLIHIPAKDTPDFRSFIGKALNEGVAGQGSTWSSSARRGKPPVKVQLTPGATVQTQSAGQCRMLSAQVHQRQTIEAWQAWFCQQTDGSWKIGGLK